MTSSAEPLLQLATAAHDTLTHAELTLLSDAATARFTFHADAPEPPADITSVDEVRLRQVWGEDRIIRSSVIRWLYTDAKARERVQARQVRVRGCLIVGPLAWNDAQLPWPLDFRDCVLGGGLDLRRCSIPSISLFNCRFPEIQCLASTIAGDLTIHTCRADWPLNITATRIGGSVSCFASKRIEISGDGAVIGGEVTLEGLEYAAEDRLTLVLRNAQVGGRFILHAATGLGLLRLDRTTFGGDLSITRVTFERRDYPNGLVAEDAIVHGDLFWAPEAINDRTLLNLQGARVKSFGDTASGWVKYGNLSVNGFQYTRLLRLTLSGDHLMVSDEDTDASGRLGWLTAQPLRSLTRQPYEELAKWLRSKGLEREAVRVLISGERDLRASRHDTRLARVWSGVLRLTTGYGYDPLRSIAWIIAEVVIGAVVFKLAFDHRALVDTTDKGARTTFNPFFYSLDVFLPIVDFNQAQFWIPTGHGLLGAVTQWFAWFHIAVGWMLSTLAVAGFSGLVRTDKK
jgi:hypothetical protein